MVPMNVGDDDVGHILGPDPDVADGSRWPDEVEGLPRINEFLPVEARVEQNQRRLAGRGIDGARGGSEDPDDEREIRAPSGVGAQDEV